MDQIAPKDALSHADGLLIGLRWAFKFKYLSYKSTQAKAIIDQKKKIPKSYCQRYMKYYPEQVYVSEC